MRLLTTTLIIIFPALLVECMGSSSNRLSNNKFCQGRGYRDNYGQCRCIGNYFGQNCEYQHCPAGQSWFSRPYYNNHLNPTTECSSMGYCNMLNGTCQCRTGYEGQACERLACPSIRLNSGHLLPCSGHGVCRSLRDAGREFDGQKFVNPPSDYMHWDADRIQGCVCDVGFEGPDCSQRSCPKGRDPLSRDILYATEDTTVLQCKASAGFFFLQFYGEYSGMIPFDADAAYLQFILGGILSNKQADATVEVKIPTDESTGYAVLCRNDQVVSTQIIFQSADRARWPPIRLLRNVSPTALWSEIPIPLSLFGSTTSAVLRMSTMHKLTCHQSSDCAGKILFSYNNDYDYSTAIDLSTAGAASLIRSAVLSLVSKRNLGYTSLNVSVSYSSTDKVCSSTINNTMSIEIHSDYGNLPFLGFVDATYSNSSCGISFLTNAGNSSVFECSRQGFCDHYTGLCSCPASFVPPNLNLINAELRVISEKGGGFVYRAVSGDGRGNAGSRGDCGHIAIPLQSCLTALNEPICSGHGVCNNHSCSCFEGWHGVICSYGDCPTGRAFFDEPYSDKVAHRPVECSNAGFCDRKTGQCQCRDGFFGSACEKKDCLRDGSGMPCHGHGSCLSIKELLGFQSLQYINTSEIYFSLHENSSVWDADTWFECACSDSNTYNYGDKDLNKDLLRPTLSPQGIVNGHVVSSLPMSGFAEWNCAARTCPLGHDARPYFPTARLEEQRVLCSKSVNNRTNGFFLLFGNSLSNFISPDAVLGDIRAAIEFNVHVGNITVHFPNAYYDGIYTACSPHVNNTHGGFVVSFVSNIGDLPILKPFSHTPISLNLSSISFQRVRKGVDPYIFTGLESLFPVNASDVEVYTQMDGFSRIGECSGPSLGLCDRAKSICICNRPYGSSDGLEDAGPRGDCSYIYS